MWFKNAIIFKVIRADFFSQIQLELLLSQTKFRECGATELSTFGWDSALPDTTNLVHSVDNNNYQLIRACKATKTLPTDFLNREIAKQVKVIEAEQSRKVTKKEKEQIKEDLLFHHLPNAFPTYKHTDVYLDNVNQLLIVNTATRGTAEDVLALLRSCIGTLPVTNYFTEPLQDCLNHWVDGQRDIEPEFVLGGNVQFSASGETPAQAKFTNEEDITAKSISNFVINEDRDVNYLSLEFDEAFYFTLDAKGFLKGIKPFDVLAEHNEDIDTSEDLLARIDADFVLFAKEMGRLFYSFSEMKITDETKRDVFDVSTISYPTLKEMAGEALEGFTVTVSKPEERTEESDEDDTLLNEAKAFVIERRKVSISAIQRQLRTGYNRSARIVEQLENQGVVSAPGHNGVREVLVLEEV